MREYSVFARMLGRTGIIAVSVFLNFAGFTLIIPILPFSVARYVPASEVAFWVSMILSAYAFCSFLAAPVLGALSDRLGRRPVLLGCLCASAFGYALFGLGGALWVLILGRFIEGLTAGSISAMYAYVADTHDPRERGPAYGRLGAAGGLGFMAGPVLGGVLGEISVSAPLYGAALLALLNAAWIFLALPESHPVERRGTGPWLDQINPIGPLARALRLPRLRPLFAVIFCFACGSTMFQSNLTVLLRDTLAFTPALIGLVLFGVGVMDIVSQGMIAPRLLRRFGEGRVALAGLVVTGLGLLLLAVFAILPWRVSLILGIGILTLGDGLFQPSANAMVSDAAPGDRQGEAQGANQAQQSIAHMVGPLAGAGLYGLSATAPYVAAAALVFLGAMVLAAAGGDR